ncbi:2-hydroxyacid dehydrogenase [Actinoalloteichus hymeniacidonis]|uniref:Lactate dehydrogenase-like oxidoreductase n=1 Tax=Actinoalloteichus hymeniacidonis TaxID=340345 RepID=A0AAC9HTB2_9PSEU|nr:2-hydroxyacid dehydrogenase [Actinoalloteichus hymeniacidonis]AOS64721.1 lactate dehydrogenase-like oxidoreductase [Actinoalloteichus hymeniacidonis]MBB5907203.1 lactate dehydrogenase-like 2-hydroxyacid dehydrogenase [Actinoalloteichus hymeniacidonis]
MTATPTSEGIVLQTIPLLPSLTASLAANHRTVVLSEQDDPAAFLAERGAEVVAVVTTARIGVSHELMDALPNLGAIVHFGVGYETTDVARARSRGIDVSNTPDVLTDCVADLAVGALIDVMRKLSAADRYVRRGDWKPGAYPLTTKVSGKRIGILGLGRIGQAVARRLTGFDAEIVYHSRRPVAEASYRYVDSATTLAAESDVVVVTAAGGASTRGLVSEEVLTALGPQGFLVNVARGSVVDEPALVAALVAGRIAGAALDVFVDEPNVPAELLGLDSVVLLPHIASGTTETREAMGDLAFRNLHHFMAEGTLLTPVPTS